MLQNMFALHVDLQDQIKMARVIVTLRIMQSSPEVDLREIEKQALKMIEKFAGDLQYKSEQQPVAFGLKALMLTFVMDEAKGSTDELESRITGIEGVNSVEVVDVRRAVG